MITRQEIMDFSREFGLTANVVEKDYVLGWVLAGISYNAELGPSWTFKGGTCLKKCYFETYRFSEDLDFTVTGHGHMDQAFLLDSFRHVAGWIYDTSGIEIPQETIRFDIYENPRGKPSAQGRIGYRGPMQPRGDLPRIRLDVTDDEIMVLEPTSREVHHPYSDRPESGLHVLCYSFEELFAEKIRALGERERPRDLYDVVHLYRHDSARPDRAVVLDTLREKCAFKGIPLPTVENLERRPERAELEAEWENMLAHQLPALPPFEQFWGELPAVFDWLYRAVEEPAPVAISAMRMPVDETWRPPTMATAWHTAAPFEIIRFAAANRLCVDLTYQGTSRRIEPYSLRRTQDGNLLLYAVKHATGEDRSYRVDRIEAARATNEPFKAKYLIELTASGPVVAPPVSRSSTSPRMPRTYSHSGPKYVYQCPICGRHFTKGSMDPSLGKHKTKEGYPCHGRTGIYVTTKY
jgi:predicted nucleotidyltransferase component of viral defense system